MSRAANFLLLLSRRRRAAPTPATIFGASLAAWYDGSDLSTLWQNTAKTTPAAADADRVRVIADKSGNGYDLIFPDDARRGTLKVNIVNGRAVVRLNGTDQACEATIPVYTETTLSVGAVLISRAEKGLSGAVVVTTGTTNTLTGVGAASPIIEDEALPSGYRDSARNSKGFHSFPIGAPIGILSVYDGTNHITYGVNGIAQPAVAENSAFNVDTIRVGSLYTPDTVAAYFAQDDICEIVVLRGAATPAQAVEWDAYCARRWGPWAAPQIVCDGDSHTAGLGLAAYTDTYPAALSALLGAGWTRANVGVVGQTAVAAASDAATQIDPKFSTSRTQNICLIWAGANDLSGGATAQELYDTIEAYALARQAAGWKVVVFTLLPGGADPNFETKRSAFNALLVAGWAGFADALANIAADTRIGDAGDQNDLTYYQADTVHGNAACYAIVAGIAKTAVDSIL